MRRFTPFKVVTPFKKMVTTFLKKTPVVSMVFNHQNNSQYLFLM